MTLLEQVKAIMLTPHTAWPQIEQDKRHPSVLFVNYVAVLAAIPEVASFIGHSLIGGFRPILSGLMRALVVYVVTFGVVYLVACVIDVLAPRFGGRKNFANALKLAVYSYTPVWLAGIFLLVPGLSFLLILGVYGGYLLWVGLPLMMQVPRARTVPYAIAVTASAIVPSLVLSIV
jgi:hypothetical protein